MGLRPDVDYCRRYRHEGGSDCMRTTCVSVILLLCATIGYAEQPNAGPALPSGFVAEPRTIPLWENGAPGALGHDDRDKPTITIYAPMDARETGTAVIVAPGGGYTVLATNHEGRQVANWFNALGITAFVLKYRLGPRYHHPIELGDAQRAIRLVRARAIEFGVRRDRVCIMGFSAGGRLASTAATP